MIIWSGWGILVPLYAVIGMVVGVASTSAFGVPSPWDGAIGFTLAGAVAAAATFFTARKLDAREGRVLLDERTGQRVLLKPSAGSFFFIPTRYWTWILGGAGVIFGALMASSGV